MPQAYSVSAIIPVINEARSFRAVVTELLEKCGDDIGEFVAVVCDRTTPQSLEVCSEWESRLPGRFKTCRQTLPGLGGALRKGFEEASGTHCLIVFGDGEADPRHAPRMLEIARENPEAVVSASRWMRGGHFEGYSCAKLAINFLGQKWISFLYRSSLTDFTYGYRIYPLRIARGFDWREYGHGFVPESILRPIRAGVPILETPAVWRKRGEGRSQISMLSYFSYIAVSLQCLRDKQCMPS